jgi:MinD superfamily P-loop ATPase
MKIAITGGKGGTGKSVIATALAVELAKKNKVLLVDADVDCPNDHLILGIKRKKVKNIYQTKPVWDLKKCIKCGKCSEACRANAIVFVKEKYPIFVPDLCIGCNACRIVCPTKAIGKGKQQIGMIYSGNNYGVDLVTGEMAIGYEEAGPVVNALKQYVSEIKKKYDYVIFDTAAGAHCNVISALLGCDKAIGVTEPTPLGRYDLELILKLAKTLKIPVNVVLNKAGVGDRALIESTANKYKTRIIAEVPYKKEIIEAYSKGIPIKEKGILDVVKWLQKQ